MRPREPFSGHSVPQPFCPVDAALVFTCLLHRPTSRRGRVVACTGCAFRFTALHTASGSVRAHALLSGLHPSTGHRVPHVPRFACPCSWVPRVLSKRPGRHLLRPFACVCFVPRSGLLRACVSAVSAAPFSTARVRTQNSACKMFRSYPER